MSRFQAEPMPRRELDRTIAAVAREGWNPGRNDAECFWAIDRAVRKIERRTILPPPPDRPDPCSTT